MNPDETTSLRLSEADAAALDAICERGLSKTDSRVGKLLALLGGGTCKVDRSLGDVTLARIAMESTRQEAKDRVEGEATLCPRDADALDAWELAKFDAARTPGGVRERAQRHEALRELAARGGGVRAGEAGSSLLERTMARIEAVPSRSLKFVPIAESAGGTPPWMRWRELVSVAAVLLIAASVVWPVVASARNYSRRVSCDSNLGSVASAMSHYATDNRESMPQAMAGIGSGSIWDVNPRAATANSANLYKLPLLGYSKLRDLACPGNAQACRGECPAGAVDWSSLAEISFSYQILQGLASRKLTEPGRRVVMADRSPVIRRAVAGLAVDPMENSDTHNWTGQNVLFSDGSCEWMRTPVRDGSDNIWLPSVRVVTREMQVGNLIITLKGVEVPSSPIDAFVGP